MDEPPRTESIDPIPEFAASTHEPTPKDILHDDGIIVDGFSEAERESMSETSETR